MRLMIVCWLYFPSATPRAIRWRTLAEEFVHAGHEVDLITSTDLQDTEIPELDGLCIYRVGGRLAGEVGPIFRSQAAEVTKAAELNRKVRKRVSRVICWVHDQIWKRVYWPDRACLWFPAALGRTARLLRRGSYDGLITVSLPFTSHLVGYALKRWYPTLPWIADIGDPFACQHQCPQNNYALHKRRNETWEERILAQSDFAAVTNRALADLYARMYPGIRQKVHVIPPCAPAAVQRASPRVLSSRSQVVRLIYAGKLYRKLRNPRFLLAVHRALVNALDLRCELHFIGDVSDCQAEFCRCPGGVESVVFHGMRSREETLNAIRSADVAVNIGNTTSYQLPSKLVEYAALGKKILNIVSVEGDSSEAFLRDYPTALTLRDAGAEPTREQVASLSHFINTTIVPDRATFERWSQEYQASNVAQAYLELIQRGHGLTSCQMPTTSAAKC